MTDLTDYFDEARIDRFEVALQNDAFDFSDCNHGRNILHYAALTGNLNQIKTVLDHGADVNSQDDNGMNVMHYAVLSGKTKPVRWLVKRGIDINSASRWGTPLSFAVDSGDLKMVQCLAERGADVNEKDECGKTLLLHAAERGNLKMIQKLAKNGADIKAKDCFGKTALHYAVKSCTSEFSYVSDSDILNMVKWLVKRGVPVNPEGHSSQTVLSLAVRFNMMELVQWLLENGANNQGKSFLHFLFRNDNWEQSQKLILDGADVNAKDAEGKTVLLYAAEKYAYSHNSNGYCSFANTSNAPNPTEQIQWLVEHGADVNATDIYGNTVLRYVADINDYKMMAWLVSHGADVNIQHKWKGSLLLNALIERNSTKAQFLIENGANL